MLLCLPLVTKHGWCLVNLGKEQWHLVKIRNRIHLVMIRKWLVMFVFKLDSLLSGPQLCVWLTRYTRTLCNIICSTKLKMTPTALHCSVPSTSKCITKGHEKSFIFDVCMRTGSNLSRKLSCLMNYWAGPLITGNLSTPVCQSIGAQQTNAFRPPEYRCSH